MPINFGEIVNLPALGISQDFIKFGSTSMESDKFITVCETTNGQQSVVICDLQKGNAINRRPIQAEAAIMNPVSQVIALRSGSQLQIFNMELRAKMKSHQMTDPVLFWRWISPNMIVLVTGTSVYHWSIEGDSAPQKVFDRHADLGPAVQVIGYSLSSDEKWGLLIGISKGATGGINGNMQLYSVEKRVSQVLAGHAGVFTTITPPGRTDRAQVLIFTGRKDGGPHQLFVMEVGREKDAPGGTFRLTPSAIPFPPEATTDFPVSMQVSAKHDIVFMITKFGLFFMFDVHTGKALFRTRISQDTIFATCPHAETNGILGITARKGQVIQVAINEQNLVPYIVATLRDNQLAIAIATRLNLPGAEDIYTQEFQRLMAAQDIQGAAKLAAGSPQGLLRTPQTIQMFQQLPAQPGQPQPVLQYFSLLLEKGKLNRVESLELARPVLQQGRGNLLEKWLTEDKLECSEELGDIVVQHDANMALSVYLRAKVPEKVINCFVQRGEFDKIVMYASQVGYRCDYTFMLQNLVRMNPVAAGDFATKLATAQGGALIDVNQVVEIFIQVNAIEQITAFLLEVLKGNKSEEGYLQTRLFEINLMGGFPQVADAILANDMFSHYDRLKIARLCEKCGLFQRALQHYTELDDIKRVMLNSHAINEEFLINFYGSMSTENGLACIQAMLAHNIRQNLTVVVKIATKYSEQMTAKALIGVFEKFKSFEGLYYYLGAIVNFNQDPDVHFKYIEAAAKLAQFKEVERVCRDSTVYDAVKVKEFLMDAKLQDPRPLIHVCDRNDFVEELTKYLYSNNLQKYIEVYVQKVSPQKTPMVVGKLLDLDCNEDFIKSTLMAVGQMCPVEPLVAEVEKRNRLRLLKTFLEGLVSMGNQEPATHNAIGKIYITENKDPQQFLTNNIYYESKVLGKFCEKLDPQLAFLAYQRAGGECDPELVTLCQENSLFKELAKYLVTRMNMELWDSVLRVEEGEQETPSRRALIDQVVQTALPESTNPDEVSTTVKAFMNADLPGALIELLERLVLQGSDFSNNRNLQNLLILTAIKADKPKVMDYINRLDNFDGPEIAGIAASDEHMLYEEAFTIYKKNDLEVEAVKILIDKLRDIDRASEFADRVNTSPVWSELAKAQLHNGSVTEAIASYVKADDPEDYNNVIAAAGNLEQYGDLVTYLQMVRKKIKESIVDTELIYSFAKTNQLANMEEFIAAPNVAQIQSIAERCFDEAMYEAAKILYNNINNNAKLALCYVKLKQYREAVEAASKANSVSTWKEVCYSCIAAEPAEFRLAAVCGLHIIVHPDHLAELILHYERKGHSEELMLLLEQGLGLENAHTGIFTELGIMYSKYKTAKLFEHIKIFNARLNTPKLLAACAKALMWDEVVYLYKEDNQADNAVRTMIEHATAWKQDLFLDCIQKVRNAEIHYKAISFYISHHPMQLNRLLQVLTKNLDHARVVNLLRKEDQLLLAFPYLKDVQKENLVAVNEAVNELYVEEENYKDLRVSVSDFENFDQIDLAQKTEKHELLEFRRIAATIFLKNKRYTKSIEISKKDKMYKDAIDTAAESRDPEIATDLLRFFVNLQDKECFCATLYTCYDLISPDVAMELAWRYGHVDFVMPFMIQYVKNLHESIRELKERTAPKVEPEAPPPAGVYGESMYNPGTLMLENSAYGMPQQSFAQPQYGAPGMGGGMGMGGFAQPQYGMPYGQQY